MSISKQTRRPRPVDARDESDIPGQPSHPRVTEPVRIRRRLLSRRRGCQGLAWLVPPHNSTRGRTSKTVCPAQPGQSAVTNRFQTCVHRAACSAMIGRLQIDGIRAAPRVRPRPLQGATPEFMLEVLPGPWIEVFERLARRKRVREVFWFRCRVRRRARRLARRRCSAGARAARRPGRRSWADGRENPAS